MSAARTESDGRRRSRWPWAVALAALVLVLVFLALGHRAFHATEQAAVEEFNRRQCVLASGAAHGIDLYFRTLTTALRALAGSPEVQRLDEAATRRFIGLKSQELREYGVWDVGVIDAAGVLRYSATDRPMEGADLSSRSYYQQARDASPMEAPLVEFIDFERADPELKGLLVGVPLFEASSQRDSSASAGTFAGMVCCLVTLDFLTQEFVEPVRPSEGGHAFLIDESGDILWCVDRSQFGKSILTNSEGFPTFQQVVERMRAGESGTGEFVFREFDREAGTYTGAREEKLIAFAPIRVGRAPWSIGVWAPREDALRLLHSARRTHYLEVGLSVLVVLLGSLCALVMLARFSRVLGKRVEAKTAELRESHERLLKVLDSLDAIVYVADIATHEILFVNRYTRETFGDVAGRICWQTLQSGQSGPCDFCTNERLVREDGEPAGVVVWEMQNTVNGRWYEIHDRAIRWADGRTVRLEIAIDMTQRRRQEQQIVEQNRQLREQREEIEASRKELAAAAVQVAHLIDTAARDQTMDLSYSNAHLLACWQVRSCENTWCPCHGREPMRCWQVEGTCCDRQTHSSFAEKVIDCRTCEVFRMSCPDRLTELAEGFNNMMFLLRRKAEELSQLRYHAIQQERMATIGQMAAGIAHEIDNPIASLFSLVQVLRASAPDDEARSRCALMQQCIDRISRIVREIVDFGRPVSSEEWTHGDVERLMLDTLRLLRYDRRARGVEMAVDFEAGLPKTMIIEHQLQQVFMNIVLNALDAMGGTGRLTVRGGCANGAIEVAVADTGVGMRPEQMQHIFEPFYTTKAGRKGAGLGLALSYNILQRHGGTIRVQSDEGQGATFVVSIPLREPNGEPHATSPDPGRR